MGKEKYSKEQIYKEIKRIYKINNIINKDVYNKNTTLDISWVYIVHKYGGIKNICKELDIEYRYYNQLTKVELIKMGIELYNKYGYINKELCVNNGINSSPIRNAFGNFTNYFKLINNNYEFHRNVSIEEVLEDVKVFYEKYNSTSSTLYRKKGKYSCTIINRHGGWGEILNRLNIPQEYKVYGLEYMIKEVRSIYNEYGYISRELIDSNCEFTYQAFSFHFNNKNDMSKAVDPNNENILFLNSGFKSKIEYKIAKYIDDILGEGMYEYDYYWDWLRNDKTGRVLYCDFYIPCLNLVIEYNGEQHYTFIPSIHHSYEVFLNQQYRDNIKYKLIQENNINLRVINSKENVNKELILNILNEI